MSNEDIWVENISSKGEIYYYNRETGESAWETPEMKRRPDSDFWGRFKTNKGTEYYFNFRTKESKWKKPDDFDQEKCNQLMLQREREAFYQMLSSSIQVKLNPMENRTPSIYSLKEASVRFNSDPVLINTSSERRERFLDEWVFLERKRRVELEKEMIRESKEKLKSKLYELNKNGIISYQTKWDELITLSDLTSENCWKVLLNYDRITVVESVFKDLHEIEMNNVRRRNDEIIRNESYNRRKFYDHLKEYLTNCNKNLLFAKYSDFEEDIKNIPFFHEASNNNTFSTPVDIFYNIIDEKRNPLEKIAKEIPFRQIHFDFQTFKECFSTQLSNLSEHDVQYVFYVCKMNFIITKNPDENKLMEIKSNLIQLYKRFKFVKDITDFSVIEAKLEKFPEFTAAPEELRKSLFFKYVRESY